MPGVQAPTDGATRTFSIAEEMAENSFGGIYRGTVLNAADPGAAGRIRHVALAAGAAAV